MFPRENYFLQFLAYGKDKKQKYYIIKHINKFQYNLLRKIAVKYPHWRNSFKQNSTSTVKNI